MAWTDEKVRILIEMFKKQDIGFLAQVSCARNLANMNATTVAGDTSLLRFALKPVLNSIARVRKLH